MLAFTPVTPLGTIPTHCTAASVKSTSARTPPQFLACSRYSTFTGIATIPNMHGLRHPTATRKTTTVKMGLSDLSNLKDVEGNALDMAQFSGKVVFAMNVASACGYTKSGYALFQKLGEQFAASDVVSVAIPCNAFGAQENGSPDEIKTFALARADRLVITERTAVNGGDAHPIVALAKKKFAGAIKWNFDGRFVFDRNGDPVAKFNNTASDKEIIAEIEKHI